jgi:hypothetical protein
MVRNRARYLPGGVTVTYSPSVIPGAVDPTRFADHAAKVATLRAAYDDARIEALGTASLLEVTTQDAVVRRAARLMSRKYPLQDVADALVKWSELYEDGAA